MTGAASADRRSPARVGRLNPDDTDRGKGLGPVRAVMPAVLALLIGLLGAACATTVVQPGSEYSGTGFLERPDRILVYDFAVTTDEVKENRGLFQSKLNEFEGITTRDHEQDIAAEVRTVAAEELVEGIQKLGLPAERAAANVLMPPRTLGIVGQFVDVDEGSRLQRMVIGFGQGKSRVDIRVQVYGHGLIRDDLKKKEGAPVKVLAFETHADSGTAVTLGVTGIKSNRSAMGQMTARSAEQAVAYLSEFFFNQGWIAPDKVIRAERK